MSALDRIWRAAAALVAGSSMALEHLRDAAEPAPEPEPLRAACPECAGSLDAGPHFHGEHAYWACEERHSVLVTDARGAMLA